MKEWWQSVRRHADTWDEASKQTREEQRAKLKRDNTEFLPAVLEVLERPPNPLGRIVLWVIMAFLAIALAWACLGHIDVVAVAQGRIIPDGRIKTVQTSEQGVVRAIHVRDGQPVEEGDALIELDPTLSEAEVEQAREALAVAAIDRARAQALLDYAANSRRDAFAAPEGTNEALAETQRRIVAARIEEQEAAIAALGAELRQRRGDRAMVAADVARLDQQLPLVESQLQSLRNLEAEGFAARLRVTEAEERAIGMRQDVVIRRAELSRARAAEAGAHQRLEAQRTTFRREALDAFNEADATARLRAQEFAMASERNRRTILTAPSAGIVQQVQVTTIGGVVRPADPLLVIVPEGTRLVVEANVLNRDAGFVREGQPVRVKLEAFPFTRYGIVSGRLVFLSHDAIEQEDVGLVFPARVELTQQTISVNGHARALTAGMAVTAEIRTGRRRIIEFLLSPIARRVEEAGRER